MFGQDDGIVPSARSGTFFNSVTDERRKGKIQRVRGALSLTSELVVAAKIKGRRKRWKVDGRRREKV